MVTFVKKVCSTCGSDKVLRDAYAEWNTETQEWELQNTFDAAYCESCEDETSIEEAALDGDALIEARAHYLAVDHGWLLGDEDTAREYCNIYGDELDPTKPVDGEEPFKED